MQLTCVCVRVLTVAIIFHFHSVHPTAFLLPHPHNNIRQPCRTNVSRFLTAHDSFIFIFIWLFFTHFISYWLKHTVCTQSSKVLQKFPILMNFLECELSFSWHEEKFIPSFLFFPFSSRDLVRVSQLLYVCYSCILFNFMLFFFGAPIYACA